MDMVDPEEDNTVGIDSRRHKDRPNPDLRPKPAEPEPMGLV